MKTLLCAAMVCVCCAGCGKSSSTPDPSVNFADVVRRVDDLVANGAVEKIDPNANEAYISLPAWSLLNIDQRKNLGALLGHYCGHKKGTNLYWVEIKDYQSGKRLAKWSKSWGYTDGD